jgi:hypothetical protein
VAGVPLAYRISTLPRIAGMGILRSFAFRSLLFAAYGALSTSQELPPEPNADTQRARSH